LTVWHAPGTFDLVPRATIVLIACLAALPACGGQGEGENKTFEGDGYSFTYPADWEEGEVGEVNPGATFLTAFGPGEGLDALIFEINDGGPHVDESNIGAFQEELAAAIQESTEGPTRLTVAGLPALRIVAHPQPGRSRRVTSVFDATTMYIFDCGFATDRAAEMLEGCDLIEESLEIE
jgi:hypothetical protein